MQKQVRVCDLGNYVIVIKNVASGKNIEFELPR